MVLLSFTLAVLLLCHAVSVQSQSCGELGGECKSPLSTICPYGGHPVNCGINGVCCAKKPPTTPACKKKGGYCHVPLREPCPSGVSLGANCGINGRCCKPRSA